MRIKSIIMVEGGHNNNIKNKYYGIGGFLGVEGGHMAILDPPWIRPCMLGTIRLGK
jgi:hypothetical protein